jgi:hypothetical protein
MTFAEIAGDGTSGTSQTRRPTGLRGERPPPKPAGSSRIAAASMAPKEGHALEITAPRKEIQHAVAQAARQPDVPGSMADEFCCVFNAAVGSQSHSPEQYYCYKFVAVGTAIARRPPHRSQRAALPHWAPTSGHDAKPHIGEWMSQARGRQPAIDQPLHSLPWYPAILAPPPKRAMPVPGDMIVE